MGGEVRGGLTTFMVMAFIIFVNPAILGFAGIPALQGQGPPLSSTLPCLQSAPSCASSRGAAVVG